MICAPPEGPIANGRAAVRAGRAGSAPAPRICEAYGHDMNALLTIATFEGNGGSSRQVQESSGDCGATDPRQPTQVQIGSGYDQQLHICPVSPHHPDHPHLKLMHWLDDTGSGAFPVRNSLGCDEVAGEFAVLAFQCPSIRLPDRHQFGCARHRVAHVRRAPRRDFVPAVHFCHGQHPQPGRRVVISPAMVLLAEVDLRSAIATDQVRVVLGIDLKQLPRDDISRREALPAALDLPVIDPNRQRHALIVRARSRRWSPAGLRHRGVPAAQRRISCTSTSSQEDRWTAEPE